MASSKFVGAGARARVASSILVQQTRSLSRTVTRRLAQPRSTLSKVWAPIGSFESGTQDKSGHGNLLQAGFLRQSHPGIYQVLPYGLRVQQKIEDLLDKHMRSIGASRLALSTITSESLWKKSNRLEQVSPELFRFTDRRDKALMLSPTHEEEITTLISSLAKSYKAFPLRLFQITRKYRDEIRPRHGLLRSREFLMKDLYTYDLNVESAIETYKEVAEAYRAFFAELKLPITVAEASSGDMGGDHSHEYHLANEFGEDTVATCNSCGYAASDEVATARPKALPTLPTAENHGMHLWRGISKDRTTLINAWYHKPEGLPAGAGLNIHAVKAVVPQLDASVEDPLRLWQDRLKRSIKDDSIQLRLVNVVDSRLADTFASVEKTLPVNPLKGPVLDGKQTMITKMPAGADLNLSQIAEGDHCPKCDNGTLQLQRTLELGHTFHLGTRYTTPLKATVALPDAPADQIPLQMGCHGIGVSRILGSVAEHMSDDKGLLWPRAIAPFEVAIIPSTSHVEEPALKFYDFLAGENDSGTAFDVVLDDRDKSFGRKIKDADMAGYPVLVVLGSSFRDHGLCEVQCRKLGLKEDVPVAEVPKYLEDLLARL